VGKCVTNESMVVFIRSHGQFPCVGEGASEEVECQAAVTWPVG
jgi:hypothetical protein